MNTIILTDEQLSYLFNNMSVDKYGDWEEHLDFQCGDFFEHPEVGQFTARLSDEDIRDMEKCVFAEVDELLHQVKIDVVCGAFNNTTNRHIEWSLGVLSGILHVIN